MAIFTDGVFSDIAGGGAPSGPAGGGLSGTFPNPDVVLTATQIAFGSGTNTLTSSSELTYVTATGVFDQVKALAGAVMVHSLRNTSSSANAGSRFRAEVASASATGDAVYQAAVAGGRVFTWGIDVSETGQPFVLAVNAALGTGNLMTITSSPRWQFGSGAPAADMSFGFQVISGTNALRISDNANTLIGPTIADVASTALRVNAAKTIASAAGAVWNGVDVTAATATLSGSTAITTATGFNLAVLRAPTLSAASALAVSFAATLYVEGAPIAAGAGPATITNAYAIWVDAGLARFDGNGTRVFELPADATANVTVGTGRVPIFVGGVTKFLRYYDD